tara:strand:+ start:889 stop:1437 length:549 start_codon:yes stop_codon:yes gene_type:complete
MSVIIDPILQQANITLNADNVGQSGLPGGTSESLIELKYSFTGFNQQDMHQFKKGDVVVLEHSDGINSYNTIISKASTNSVTHADRMLLVFFSYIGSTLILMHKGYLDFDNISSEGSENSLESWEIGKTLYLNNNKISISPPAQGGNWVKSIGFCMPNKVNKKRIWFESDSTYLVLQQSANA